MTKKTYNTVLAIGLTGGIGSGKTAVGRIFEKLGAMYLQADLIARDLINSDAQIKQQIRSLFGDDIYQTDGSLDRQRVGSLIFSDQSLQKKINQIVHPVVIEYIEQQIKTAVDKKSIPIILIEAALIYEAGVETMFDYTIVVDADMESRIARLMRRDHRNREEIQQRIDAQLDQSKKTDQADFVIRNNSSMQILQQQCEFLFHLFTTISNSLTVSQTKGQA